MITSDKENNYVGASFDFESDCVNVWERSSKEERILKRYKAPRYFYTPAENGEYKSIFGESLERHDFDSLEEWNAALKDYKNYPNKHESDIQPLFKVLMNEYYQKPNPILNFAFVDIETDVRMENKDWDLTKKIKIRKKQ